MRIQKGNETHINILHQPSLFVANVHSKIPLLHTSPRLRQSPRRQQSETRRNTKREDIMNGPVFKLQTPNVKSNHRGNGNTVTR